MCVCSLTVWFGACLRNGKVAADFELSFLLGCSPTTPNRHPAVPQVFVEDKEECFKICTVKENVNGQVRRIHRAVAGGWSLPVLGLLTVLTAALRSPPQPSKTRRGLLGVGRRGSAASWLPFLGAFVCDSCSLEQPLCTARGGVWGTETWSSCAVLAVSVVGLAHHHGSLLLHACICVLITGHAQQVTVFDDAYKSTTVDAAHVCPVNPDRLAAVEDNTELMYLHDPSLLRNIEQRYNRHDIYTYTAFILVAVNPYVFKRPLPVRSRFAPACSRLQQPTSLVWFLKMLAVVAETLSLRCLLLSDLATGIRNSIYTRTRTLKSTPRQPSGIFRPMCTHWRTAPSMPCGRGAKTSRWLLAANPEQARQRAANTSCGSWRRLEDRVSVMPAHHLVFGMQGCGQRERESERVCVCVWGGEGLRRGGCVFYVFDRHINFWSCVTEMVRRSFRRNRQNRRTRAKGFGRQSYP